MSVIYVTNLLLFMSEGFSTLKIEAAGFSKTSIPNYQTTRIQIPEYRKSLLACFQP
jgi:hypothetical protein